MTTFALLLPQAAHASTDTRPAPVSLPSGSGATQVRFVSYHGLRVTVPAIWPVIDLTRHPQTCVRLDRAALYLGSSGAQPDCPAHAVGRADTIWLKPTTAGRENLLASREVRVGTLPALAGASPVNHEKHARFVARSVDLEATWGASSGTVDRVLASVEGSPGPSAPTTKPTPPAAASTSGGPATAGTAAPAGTKGTAATKPGPVTAGTSTAAQSALVAGSTFTGMAFDACSAPSISTMTSWLASPYRSVGVYIGGAMRACGDGNLSASWVSQVHSKGWGLLPIYVGLQAPCVTQSGLSTISASQAGAQGRAGAADAVAKAKFFGLGPGTPIYFDMESYNAAVAGCSTTVLTFMSAWTSALHSLGYKSGAYGSSASLMVDMSRATGFVAPDNVWFAHWNGLQNTSDASSYPSFPNTRWSAHQRVHQYSGGFNQKWGGVSVNIDANWVDAAVAGSPVPVAYGTNVLGPGSNGFVFTGSMAYWRPEAPAGLKKMAYWTYSSGSTEGNGATWSPKLSPGVYDVQANIPLTGSTAKAPYTIRDAAGTTTRVLNQGSRKGYVSLGTHRVLAGRPISVHVGDNDATSTSTQIGVDAMAFRLVGTPPGLPVSVSATAGDARATVRWGAAAANGSPVTSYTVKATPGGATASVSGSATSLVLTGLTNGTAYRFTVTAASAVGSGAPSAPSAAVVPSSRTLPMAPSGVSAAPGSTQATVSWTAPASNGGSAITRYSVRVLNGVPSSQVGLPRTVATGATRLTVTGLANGTAYRFTVAAANATGTGPASAPSAPITPRTVPGAPRSVSAAPGSTQAALWWTAPASNGGAPITGYTVRVLNAGTNVQAGPLRPAVAGTTSVTIAGLVNGTRYAFQILARNAAGPGPYSALSSPATPITTAAVTRLSDFTRDGITDLVARDATGTLWLYPGNGSGGLLARRKMGSGWNTLTAIVTPGDVNGDGIADVIGRTSAGALWLYPGNAAGTLVTRRRIGSGWGGYTITSAANLNGAGSPDLLARDPSGNLWLYPLSGNAVFGRRTVVATGWGSKASILGPGDVSGDGKADVLARDAAGSLWLYRGNGSGAIGAGVLVGTGWPGGATGQQMTALVTHGNGDRAGGNDLVTRSSAGVLWLYPGNNAGGFGPPRVIGTGWQAMTYLG